MQVFKSGRAVSSIILVMFLYCLITHLKKEIKLSLFDVCESQLTFFLRTFRIFETVVVVVIVVVVVLVVVRVFESSLLPARLTLMPIKASE